jgi:hypothetical protein
MSIYSHHQKLKPLEEKTVTMSTVHQANMDRDHVTHPVVVSLHDAHQSVIAGTLNNERDVNFSMPFFETCYIR